MGSIWRPILLGLAAAACGGRAHFWDDQPAGVQTYGLSGSVAVLDPSLHRLLMLTSPRGLELGTSTLPVGINPSIITTDERRERLFVLSSGAAPRRKTGDEWPSFSVVDGSTAPRLLARYDLAHTNPFTGIALDPAGQWAVLYQPPTPTQGATTSGLLTNPNELMLVQLPPAGTTAPVDTTQGLYLPQKVTLENISGQPRDLMFTPEFQLEAGVMHRLLVVQTDHEVVLVDLNDVAAGKPVSQTVVPLPTAPNNQAGSPAEVVACKDPNEATSLQGFLAVRLNNDANVVIYTVTLTDKGDVHPTSNEVAVGGVPSDIEFVHATAGELPMLAALVPGTSPPLANLIDAATGRTQTVNLPGKYDHMELVTEQVGGATPGTDVALLWGPSSTTIGFWKLEKAVNTPYSSVDTNQLAFSPSGLHDVVRDHSDTTDTTGKRDFTYLRILEASQQKKFYVVNLRNLASPPIVVSQPNFQLLVAPDGERAWAFNPSSSELGLVDFSTLHTTSLTLERNVTAAYDILQPAPPIQVGGAIGDLLPPRALVALHGSGSGSNVELDATVLDAHSPDAANTKYRVGLLLGGAP
jgi:hypothetical protein